MSSPVVFCELDLGKGLEGRHTRAVHVTGQDAEPDAAGLSSPEQGFNAGRGS